MTGKKLVLAGMKLADLSAPKLATLDPIESAGSLFLMEPAHPLEPWAITLPTDGGTVPNLFGSNLATLGATGATDASVVYDPTFSGTIGTLERSAAGGLHGIVTHQTFLSANDGVGFKMPYAVWEYTSANVGHKYYVSIWDRLTRANQGTSSEYVVAYNTGGSNFNYGILSANEYWWAGGVSGGIANGETTSLGNALGPRSADAAHTGSDMQGSTYHWIGPSWGTPRGHASASAVTRDTRNPAKAWPSYVFYRYYMEDLTVSGRTYEEVHAIDQALYQREVLTPGGRYYGDTFTDPATLP